MAQLKISHGQHIVTIENLSFEKLDKVVDILSKYIDISRSKEIQWKSWMKSNIGNTVTLFCSDFDQLEGTTSKSSAIKYEEFIRMFKGPLKIE